MPHDCQTRVDITVLVCTYNRSNDLRELLHSALAQDTGGEFTYEVLIVDNNSQDDTRAVAEAFLERGHRSLRYVFEPRQGRSYALNLGLRAARGQIYALADDDLILPENWLREIVSAFHAHPEASVVGGKVLPLFKGQSPPWLTRSHWSAIAMADYGDHPFIANAANPVCLLAGSFRLADVKAVGGYSGELGVSRDRIGGTEDVDLLSRLYKAGRHGVYVPQILVHHKVQPERLTKRYHRRWHLDHGRSYALMRDEAMERSAARIFGVPGHLYRAAAMDAVAWLKNVLRGRSEEAFWYETRLRFFAGFFRQRSREAIWILRGHPPEG